MLGTLRSLLVSALANVLYRCGFFRLFFRCYRHVIPIVMVHGVSSGSEKRWQPTWQRTDVQQLEEYLQATSQYFEYIDMDEAVAMLSGKQPMRQNCIVLTFDDGYRNNATVAGPLLSERSIPAVFYVVSAALHGDFRFWIDRLDYVLQQLSGQSRVLSLGENTFELVLRDRSSFKQSYLEFRRWAKNIYQDDGEFHHAIQTLIGKLESEVGKSLIDIEDDEWSATLDAGELNALPVSIAVGSHTNSHVRSTHIPLQQFREELVESQRELSALRAAPCRHFCYPNGDADEVVAAAVEDQGYDSAVTVKHGVNRVGDNLYLLKRIPIARQQQSAVILLDLCRKFLLAGRAA